MPRKLDPEILFANLSSSQPVLVAVSGGSDSVALLLLAAAWAKMSKGQIVAATVDHGLRPEAAAEAAFVAGLCEGLDISHVTLSWEGIKPRSSISEAAREARYRLLSEFASDCGCDTVVVGHTADDQVETLMMRNARGDENSDSLGLSGMASETRLPGGVRLLRPLLGVSRQELREYLKQHTQGWIEDPSNDDLSYERVRIRHRAKANQSLAENYYRFGQLTGRFRKCISQDLSQILFSQVAVKKGPVYHVDTDSILQNGHQLARYLLQVVIAMAGGGPYRVRSASLDEFMSHEEPGRTTIGNAVIERGKGEYRIFREDRNMKALVVEGGDSAIWDNRVVVNNNSRHTIVCGTPTAGQLANLEKDRTKKLDVKPRAALLSTLMICTADDHVYLPFAADGELPKNVTIQPICRSIEHFCPDFDFPLLAVVEAFKSRLHNFGSLPG